MESVLFFISLALVVGVASLAAALVLLAWWLLRLRKPRVVGWRCGSCGRRFPDPVEGECGDRNRPKGYACPLWPVSG